MHISACLFDLDGVIVDTAKYHYLAWRRLANSLGFDFSEAQNEQLKGVSRMQSLRIILEMGGLQRSESELDKLAAQKNEWYLAYVDEMTPDEILPGVVSFLEDLQQSGIRIGLGSASKNARRILDHIGLTHFFDTIIDGNQTTRGKPDPQVFLLGAQALGVDPNHCVVFEDAPKGVEAALAGGFYAIGIGSADHLGHAHLVIPGFEDIDHQVFAQLPPQ